MDLWLEYCISLRSVYVELLFKGIASRDQYFYESSKNRSVRYGTFCTSADGFRNFWLSLCVEKFKMKSLPASMKSFTNSEYSFSNPLQEACFGFQIAAVTLAVVPSAAENFSEKKSRRDMYYYFEHWWKWTNKREGQPEQKFWYDFPNNL